MFGRLVAVMGSVAGVAAAGACHAADLAVRARDKAGRPVRAAVILSEAGRRTQGRSDHSGAY